MGNEFIILIPHWLVYARLHICVNKMDELGIWNRWRTLVGCSQGNYYAVGALADCLSCSCVIDCYKLSLLPASKQRGHCRLICCSFSNVARVKEWEKVIDWAECSLWHCVNCGKNPTACPANCKAVSVKLLRMFFFFFFFFFYWLMLKVTSLGRIFTLDFDVEWKIRWEIALNSYFFINVCFVYSIVCVVWNEWAEIEHLDA